VCLYTTVVSGTQYVVRETRGFVRANPRRPAAQWRRIFIYLFLFTYKLLTKWSVYWVHQGQVWLPCLLFCFSFDCLLFGGVDVKCCWRERDIDLCETRSVGGRFSTSAVWGCGLGKVFIVLTGEKSNWEIFYNTYGKLFSPDSLLIIPASRSIYSLNFLFGSLFFFFFLSRKQNLQTVRFIPSGAPSPGWRLSRELPISSPLRDCLLGENTFAFTRGPHCSSSMRQVPFKTLLLPLPY